MAIPSELLSDFTYKGGKLYRWGKEAGFTIKFSGYRSCMIKGKNYLVHRLIFLMHHGYLPTEVDHINTNPSDNRIENLREASSSENKCNSSLRSDNTSGIKGVCWDENRGKWMAQLSVKGSPAFRKRFDTLEEAEKAVRRVRERMHGDFYNHGDV